MSKLTFSCLKGLLVFCVTLWPRPQESRYAETACLIFASTRIRCRVSGMDSPGSHYYILGLRQPSQIFKPRFECCCRYIEHNGHTGERFLKYAVPVCRLTAGFRVDGS